MVNNQLNEYYCDTCKVNEKLDRFIQYEAMHKNTYVPPRIRTTHKIGIIFTKDSIMWLWHTNHGSHHEWGNVYESECTLRAIKK